MTATAPHVNGRKVWVGIWAACGFLVGLAVAIAGVFVVRWVGLFHTGPTFDSSRPSVVRQIRELHRLETVVFAMDKIVSGGYENRYLPRMLAGDRLLLVVYGDVTAGVDLDRVEMSSVNVEGRRVRLVLPAAQVFATRIDNQRTRVYSRETGLFSRVDPDLETDVRREAERQVTQAALDGGILQTATANATATLKAFLQGLGFEQIDVRTAQAP